MSNFVEKSLYLGIDVGSVSISYALLDRNKQLIKSEYFLHQGNIVESLETALQNIDFSHVHQLVYNHKAAEFFNCGTAVNEQIAHIEAIRLSGKIPRSLFNIGGETFGLILFDEKGKYKKYISNSSCAAGTGAFLDQQAERLGLTGSSELSKLADSFEGEPPKIATRCAVFAKTDLTHFQQNGYSLPAISAGLCKGLASNIIDTLLSGITLSPSIVLVGGVSRNQKVVQYLSEIIGFDIEVPDHSEKSVAIGCAAIAAKNKKFYQISNKKILKKHPKNKEYFFPPLKSNFSTFPDFTKHTQYLSNNVEVDLYNDFPNTNKIPVYLGIDIGSTSTKAILMQPEDKQQKILLGLYTRTMAQPIKAVQSILKVLTEIENKNRVKFNFLGVGTTGSGRKFIQKVLNTDFVVDEITAHARAAYNLNKKIDTIIEIGGQDSKFTILKNGQVTFSVMNYVCAAGTGSFIEEQAKRLNVPLDKYADLASGTPSPLTSDRCTVFMERDLNHLLSLGYSKEELLAATLHSVRDNYLAKVANTSKIGNVICFQGATAKNRALVSAFEQKLKKPIFVSRYCHLTGALGVCLLMHEQSLKQSDFRGINFYKESIKVNDEICELCKNHCKLKRVYVANDSFVWGFLCGRDETGKMRKSIRRKEFDLLKSRRIVFNAQKDLKKQKKKIQKLKFGNFKNLELEKSLDNLISGIEINWLNLRHTLFTVTNEELIQKFKKNKIKIGIPEALYLHEYTPFWKMFFKKLGYPVIVSRTKKGLLKKGKEISGAEFCAPMSCWHGHIDYLNKQADFIFLPQIFEEGDNEDAKKYCYYSNYAVALIQNLNTLQLEKKCISPIINLQKSDLSNIQKIYDSLPTELKFIQTPGEIQEAFKSAWQWYMGRKNQLTDIFQRQFKNTNDISVVLMGRPYLVMDADMSKNIPKKFTDLGIKTFFQDMLPKPDIENIALVKDFDYWNHWIFGEQILFAAEYIVQNPGLYPVYLTAFKCSPDSFILNYFKEIMDVYQIPYLILQVDEHDSDTGYETRIEAAIRSFRNHFHQSIESDRTLPKVQSLKVYDKNHTVLIPNYDHLSCRLISAAFMHAGYDSKLIEQSQSTILSSLRLNDGQCLPVSTIVQGAMETIQRYKLDPQRTSLFMNAITRLSCNFPQYPIMAKKLLEQNAQGFEKVNLFATEFDMRGFPFDVITNVYCSYLLGGLIRRLACKIRPYELKTGTTDEIMNRSCEKLYHCIATGASKEKTFKEIVSDFAKIETKDFNRNRPKVGIIGDLYVRDNDSINQHLIYDLEKYGAEVVTTPFTYVLRILSVKHIHLLKNDGKYWSLVRHKLLIELLEKFERRYYDIARPVLNENFPTIKENLFENLEKYKLSIQHGGETVQNILKIFSMLDHYKDISLFVHVNPIFCCPGLVSESLFKSIENDVGVPIVSITYDGTSTNRNEVLAPYLHFLNESSKILE